MRSINFYFFHMYFDRGLCFDSIQVLTFTSSSSSVLRSRSLAMALMSVKENSHCLGASITSVPCPKVSGFPSPFQLSTCFFYRRHNGYPSTRPISDYIHYTIPSIRLHSNSLFLSVSGAFHQMEEPGIWMLRKAEKFSLLCLNECGHSPQHPSSRTRPSKCLFNGSHPVR